MEGAPNRRLRTVSKHLTRKAPMVVAVTGAAGQIGYALLPMICRGLMLGTDQPLILHLLDIPQAIPALGGVVMELNDCAFPLVEQIKHGADPLVMLKDVDVAIFLGGFPRKAGMERKELLSRNIQIFKAQGEALNQVAKPTTKCLVVANPANTNCLALAHFAPKLPRENFTCLTRLDMNRAVWQVADRAHAPVTSIRNITIWGNHSATQYPDVNQGCVGGQSIRQFLQNDQWLNGEFISTVQKRGAAIIAARKLSSAMSAASASVDHVHDWLFGTRHGKWVSMGVISNGEYGVPKGLVFSYPVHCQGFKWEIVPNIPLDQFSRDKIAATTQELLEERKEGLSL